LAEILRRKKRSRREIKKKNVSRGGEKGKGTSGLKRELVSFRSASLIPAED